MFFPFSFKQLLNENEDEGKKLREKIKKIGEPGYEDGKEGG